MKAEEVKAIRGQLKLSQSKFAKAIGVGPVTVCRWENNKTHPSPLAERVIRELEAKSPIEMSAKIPRRFQVSLKIPMINGVRPTPKTTQVMTEEQVKAKWSKLIDELTVQNLRSKEYWNKWADPRWKVPQESRQYTKLPNGQIVRA